MIATVSQFSILKFVTFSAPVLGVCFVLGWSVGQGSLVSTVERAYIAMFESMAPDRNRTGEYYVVYSDFESLQNEVDASLSAVPAVVEPTELPNTAKIVFANAADASFDTVESLESVKFIMGSALPFMCH